MDHRLIGNGGLFEHLRTQIEHASNISHKIANKLLHIYNITNEGWVYTEVYVRDGSIVYKRTSHSSNIKTRPPMGLFVIHLK